MPTRFLSPELRAKYDGYSESLSPDELGGDFFLDDNDKRFIDLRRSDKNRLGLALQLCTVRHLGHFFSDTGQIPCAVVEHVGSQLGIENAADVFSSYEDARTRERHTASVRKFYGYFHFTEQPYYFRFQRWLYTRAWLTSERPTELFEKSREYLKINKIIVPGVTVLERVIGRVMQRVSDRLWKERRAQAALSQRTRRSTRGAWIGCKRDRPLEYGSYGSSHCEARQSICW